MRRIRRIVPASLAMVIATFIAGLIILLPQDLMELSRSTVAYLAMGANVFF
jgi:peptidoglycan/LPS O-acetylase OafA/YrhL